VYDKETQVCCGDIIHNKGGCMGCVNYAWVYTCDPNQCQDCNTTTNTCQACDVVDPNKRCCYPYDGVRHCCKLNEPCCNGSCCDPTECEACVDGICQNCMERFGDCCKCENGNCTECWCWDEGQSIEGQITDVENNVPLCYNTGFSSLVWDEDHWLRDCPDHFDGYVLDTLTYWWDQTPGSSPAPGRYTSNQEQSYVSWQAPPCIGTVEIVLHTNDIPDPRLYLCPTCDGTRDDDPRDFYATVNVVLPEGCREAGGHDSSVQWVNFNDNYSSTTLEPYADDARGVCNLISVTSDVEVEFTYQDCQWMCEISNITAKTQILVLCPTCISGNWSVSSASEVPCYDANLAKCDLDDTDLSDDIGAPKTVYWCYNATCAHEETHRSDWQPIYEEELNYVISEYDGMAVTINPDEWYTVDCDYLYDWMIVEILQRFIDAYNIALVRFDNPLTPIKESEVRAYLISWAIEHPISAALPGGCGP
jgi:hypothetical protein